MASLGMCVVAALILVARGKVRYLTYLTLARGHWPSWRWLLVLARADHGGYSRTATGEAADGGTGKLAARDVQITWLPPRVCDECEPLSSRVHT